MTEDPNIIILPQALTNTLGQRAQFCIRLILLRLLVSSLLRCYQWTDLPKSLCSLNLFYELSNTDKDIFLLIYLIRQSSSNLTHTIAFIRYSIIEASCINLALQTILSVVIGDSALTRDNITEFVLLSGLLIEQLSMPPLWLMSCFCTHKGCFG